MDLHLDSQATTTVVLPKLAEDPADVDLERVVWDVEYRRIVIEHLKQAA